MARTALRQGLRCGGRGPLPAGQNAPCRWWRAPLPLLRPPEQSRACPSLTLRDRPSKAVSELWRRGHPRQQRLKALLHDANKGKITDSLSHYSSLRSAAELSCTTPPRHTSVREDLVRDTRVNRSPCNEVHERPCTIRHFYAANCGASALRTGRRRAVQDRLLLSCLLSEAT